MDIIELKKLILDSEIRWINKNSLIFRLAKYGSFIEHPIINWFILSSNYQTIIYKKEILVPQFSAPCFSINLTLNEIEYLKLKYD